MGSAVEIYDKIVGLVYLRALEFGFEIAKKVGSVTHPGRSRSDTTLLTYQSILIGWFCNFNDPIKDKVI